MAEKKPGAILTSSKLGKVLSVHAHARNTSQPTRQGRRIGLHH